MKKIIPLFCLSALCVAGPVLAEGIQTAPAVLVCRSRQCAASSYAMTSGYLYNQLVQMMEKNTDKRVLMCEADPVSHVCLTEGIQIAAETPFAPVQVAIEGAELTDTRLVPGKNEMDVVFDYQVKANNTYPTCQLGVSHLNVAYVDKVEMLTDDFACQFVDSGKTVLNATYSVDYLDFDYGFIGAYYTMGVGEAVKGDKKGYVLMRFTDKAPLHKGAVGTEPVNPKVTSGAAILKETVAENSVLKEEKAEPAPNKDMVKQPEVKIEPIMAVAEEDAVVQIVPETQPAQIIPKTVKTTVVEKAVITSEGKGRNIVVPEKRTVVEEINK